jgi:hypothetical protein
MAEKRTTNYVLAVILFVLVYLLGYTTQRHETFTLLTLYSLFFAAYAWVISKKTEDQLSFWIICAIGLRLLLLLAVPNLSDDFYRFIWDGRLVAAGHHPFAHPPSYYIENAITVPGVDHELYAKLNSKYYFTIYPAVAQFLFGVAAKFSDSIYGCLLVLKASIIATEVGSIFLLKKLLSRFNIQRTHLLMYALNPLVILELTGNVHFEAILIFFLLLTLYFLSHDQFYLAALCLAISICVKLIPIIFLPAILPLLGFRKSISFYLATLCFCAMLFLPLLDEKTINGFQNSLGYYFSRFEFNASIYFLVRELGYLFFGFNIVGVAGGVLGLIAAIFILMISFHWPNRFKRLYQQIFTTSAESPQLWRFMQAMMWSLLLYFLFTTTLHPWYITTLLALSVFTHYQFVVIWTYLIFFTYAGYAVDGFNENLLLTAFEYVIVLGYLAYELIWKRNTFASSI